MTGLTVGACGWSIEATAKARRANWNIRMDGPEECSMQHAECSMQNAALPRRQGSVSLPLSTHLPLD
jgi:hypothetical protein